MPALRPTKKTKSRSVVVAVASLGEMRLDLVRQIESVVPLTAKQDHAAALGGASVEEAGLKGGCEGYLGLPKLGWVSATLLEGGAGSLLHVSCQVAPNYDVPHLALDVCATPAGGLRLAYDVTPREDVIGSRDYIDAYYVGPVEEWYEAARTAVTHTPTSGSLAMRALASPCALHGIAPSIDVASGIARDLVSIWSSWIMNPAEINRMKRGAAYSRDNVMHKRRWFYYTDLLASLGFPRDRAAQIASVSSPFPLLFRRAYYFAQAAIGPGDEAYTGGGGGEASGV